MHLLVGLCVMCDIGINLVGVARDTPDLDMHMAKLMRQHLSGIINRSV